MGIQIGTTDISNIFLGGPVDNPRLPSAYQEVEYLESSGTQFIETDVNSLTAPFKVEVKYMKQNTDTSDQTLVGQRQLGKFVNIYDNYYENLWSNSASGTASGDDNIHTIVTDSSAGLYKDGALLVSGTSGNRSSSYNALIFAFSEDSAANAKWFLKGRIYEVKITNNGVLYRHYIPCYRKSDNVIGVYELVAGTFKTNAGSGTFGKGSNVYTNVYQKIKEVYVGTCKVRPSIPEIYATFLVVGGGGGGGQSYGNGYSGGGGGGGGFVCCTNYNIGAMFPISVTVGAGGGNLVAGKNSCFGDIVAYGGGAGRRGVPYCGGSGGGGTSGGATTPGCGCAGQGNNGGAGNGCRGAGGGGGAGGAGCTNGSNNCGGAGGAGKTSSITGVSRYYSAGGGGGGYNAGGSGGTGGGGGGGAYGRTGCNAYCCGSGGGGGGFCSTCASGGCGCKGIVVVSYPTACGYNLSGGCKYTCGSNTIHCFTSDGTLTVN